MCEELKVKAASALRDWQDVDNDNIRNILESIVNCYIPEENDSERFLVQELNYFIERCR